MGFEIHVMCPFDDQLALIWFACCKHENSVGISGSKITSLCFTLSSPCDYQSGELSLQISWKFFTVDR